MRSTVPVAGSAALGLAVMVLLGGCHSGTPTAAAPTPSASGTPQNGKYASTAAITEAIRLDRSGPYHFTLTVDRGSAGSSTTTGVVDEAKHLASSAESGTASGHRYHGKVILIGTDLYIQTVPAQDGIGPDDWTHVAGDNTTAARDMFADPADPSGLDAAGTGLDDIQQTGTDTITGTRSVNQIPSVLNQFSNEQPGTGFSTLPVTMQPFTATVDAAGHLTSMTTHVAANSSVPTEVITLRLSDFGSPVSVTKPPKDAITGEETISTEMCGGLPGSLPSGLGDLSKIGLPSPLPSALRNLGTLCGK